MTAAAIVVELAECTDGNHGWRDVSDCPFRSHRDGHDNCWLQDHVKGSRCTPDNCRLRAGPVTVRLRRWTAPSSLALTALPCACSANVTMWPSAGQDGGEGSDGVHRCSVGCLGTELEP